jgi:hypothetical protein
MIWKPLKMRGLGWAVRFLPNEIFILIIL